MNRKSWLAMSIAIALSLSMTSTALAQDDEELEFDVNDVEKAEADAAKARDKDTKGGSPDAVKAFLGDFKFGMTRKQVMKVVTKEINERYSQEWPVISEQKDSLPDAEEWKEVEKKADQFDPAPAVED